MRFLDKETHTKTLEAGIKNKWRWPWLAEKDSAGRTYSEWCKKTETAGVCFCVVCGKTISYSLNGKKALRLHGEDSRHKKNASAIRSNQLLPGAKEVTSDQKHSSVADRVAELRAVTTSFISEHCLPFSLAESLLDYAKRMNQDKFALSKVSLSRTSATYINTHGVAKYLKEELGKKLSNGYFSLNLDEATNNSNDKIVNILVQYYDEELGKVVVDHFGSKKQNLATAANIFNDVDIVLTSYGLKWYQVISMLMDNCSTMRGVRGGVETLSRKENKHLLDISGDTVHMISNAAKALFSNMDNSIGSLCSDMYYDIEMSPKVMELFTEVQGLVNLKFHVKNARQAKHLIRPISSRFLQMLDVTTRVSELLDAITVYYFSFLSDEEKERHRSKIDHIIRENKVTEEAADRITLIQLSQEQQSKSATSNDRKDRIMSDIFEHRAETVVKLNVYRGILCLFQSYIKLFQSEKPLMHRLHYEMYEVTREILGLFIKPEKIPTKVKEMLAIDVTNRDIQKSDRDLAVGRYAYVDINKARRHKSNTHWLDQLFTSLRAGYIKCATMLLKMPMSNPTLRRLSVLDPAHVQHSNTPRSLKALAAELPNVIPEDQQGQLAMEAAQYAVDPEVISVADSFTNEMRIDSDYWKKVFELKRNGDLKYPVLKRLVNALLSIFSGPLIESTFNIMDDIVEKDRASMTVDTYEGVAIVKTALKKKGEKAVSIKVNSTMKRSCINAYQTYQAHLRQKKELHKRKQEEKLNASVALLKIEKAKKISKLMKLQEKMRKQKEGMNRKRSGEVVSARKYKRIRLLD